MPLEQLAYEEAKRAIDRQSNTLDGLRSRAGVLLAAISLATSFVGGLALRSDDLSAPDVGLAAAAIFFALLAGGLCVAVLWPRAAWAFNLSADLLLPQLRASDESRAFAQLALRLEKNYKKNERRLLRRYVGLFWLFRGACLALGIETVLWLVMLSV